jgi:hypothetical protein
VGGEDDYQTRIDAPQTSEAGVDPFAPLSVLAANSDALMQTGGAARGGSAVLVGIDCAIALHGIAPWKADEVKRTLGQVAGAVWSVAPGNLAWTDRNGVSELSSVAPLRFTIDGSVLAISPSPDWMGKIIAARGRTRAAPGNASYVATLRYGQELPAYQRMMRLMDFPSLPQGEQKDADSREPLFFSENISSLAGSMSRLDSVSITARDSGAMVNETVVYRLK